MPPSTTSSIFGAACGLEIMLTLAPIASAGGNPASESASADRVPVPSMSAESPLDWGTGANVNVGGILFPHLHFNSVYGTTSSALGHEFGAGHHDPIDDGWTVQGFEAGLSARIGGYFEAFGTYHGYWENEHPNQYGGQFEEWFGKVKNLPGGLELRGGKYLNRFGFHNATHLHGWDWVDNYLVNGRFLGDDGQSTTGGELTWNLPTPWTSVVGVSVGEAQEEEEAHDDEGGDHEEFRYQGTGALFARTLTVANWTNLWNLNDFHQFRGGFSGAWGDNAWGRLTQVYGAHFQYEWRQNGLEPGGPYLRWRTEAMGRTVDALAGPLPGGDTSDGTTPAAAVGRPGSFDDWGFYTCLSYGLPVKSSVLEASFRVEYVSRVAEAGLSQRRRISPGLTLYANPERTFFIRGQYNHDEIGDSGAEDSVWLGLGFNWGGAEVR